MARPLRSWGITHFCVDSTGKFDQHHVIVVAQSRRRAAELIGTTDYQMKGWGYQPGVRDEIGGVLRELGQEGAWIVDGDCSAHVTWFNMHPARLVNNRLTVIED